MPNQTSLWRLQSWENQTWMLQDWNPSVPKGNFWKCGSHLLPHFLMSYSQTMQGCSLWVSRACSYWCKIAANSTLQVSLSKLPLAAFQRLYTFWLLRKTPAPFLPSTAVSQPAQLEWGPWFSAQFPAPRAFYLLQESSVFWPSKNLAMPSRQHYRFPGSVLQHLCLKSTTASQDATSISGLASGTQTPWGIRHINSSSISKHICIFLLLHAQKAQKYHIGHRKGLNTGFWLFKQETGRGFIWKNTHREGL